MENREIETKMLNRKISLKINKKQRDKKNYFIMMRDKQIE